MNSLAKYYSFYPYLYFTDLGPDDRVLLLTDRVERCSLPPSILPNPVTIAYTGNCEIPVQQTPRLQILKLSDEDPAIIEDNFSVMVVDVSTPALVASVRTIVRRSNRLKALVLLEWNVHWAERLLQIPGLLGSSHNKLNINKKWKILPGFSPSWFLLPYPDLRKPRFFVLPAFQTSLPSFSRNPVRKWLSKIGGFYLFARQRVAVYSKLPNKDHLRHAICNVLNCGNNKRDVSGFIKQIYVSTTNVLMVRIASKNKNYFIRFPFQETSLQRIMNNHRMIRLLYENGFTFVPKPAASEEESQYPYVVEEGIDALSIETRFKKVAPDEAVSYLRKAADKISNIHSHFGVRFTMKEPEYEKYVGRRLEPLREWLMQTGSEMSALTKLEEFLKTAFLAKTFLKSVCHGDYKIGNCLFDENGEIVGVIDWDMGSLDDITLVDIASLFAKAIRQRFGGDFISLLEKGESLGQVFLPVYQDYFKHTHTDYIPFFPAFLFYWIDRVYKQFTLSPDGRGNWATTHVVPVLAKLDQIL